MYVLRWTCNATPIALRFNAGITIVCVRAKMYINCEMPAPMSNATDILVPRDLSIVIYRKYMGCRPKRTKCELKVMKLASKQEMRPCKCILKAKLCQLGLETRFS